MTADDALAFAVDRLKAGNIGEAEGVLRQVVAHEPGNVRAKHLLGVCLASAACTRRRCRSSPTYCSPILPMPVRATISPMRCRDCVASTTRSLATTC